LLYLECHRDDWYRDTRRNGETQEVQMKSTQYCTAAGAAATVVGNGRRWSPNRPAAMSVNSLDTKESIVNDAYSGEISLAQDALWRRDHGVCFAHLERAHVLAQRRTFQHTYVHWLMLRAGLSRRDYREVVGQVPRMIASVLFSRIWIPIGNTGRARVNALKAMPVPEDLRDLVS